MQKSLSSALALQECGGVAFGFCFFPLSHLGIGYLEMLQFNKGLNLAHYEHLPDGP